MKYQWRKYVDPVAVIDVITAMGDDTLDASERTQRSNDRTIRRIALKAKFQDDELDIGGESGTA